MHFLFWVSHSPGHRLDSIIAGRVYTTLSALWELAALRTAASLFKVFI